MIVARKGIGSRIGQALRWTVFVVTGVLLNLPIIMTLMTSFKTMADINTSPPPLIFTPTLASATLIAGLVWLPALLVGGLWRACALTLGVLAGYLAYTITHHAVHHWRADNAWLRERKRWHALHHHAPLPQCFGVTSAFWDRVCGTSPREALSRPLPR